MSFTFTLDVEPANFNEVWYSGRLSEIDGPLTDWTKQFLTNVKTKAQADVTTDTEDLKRSIDIEVTGPGEGSIFVGAEHGVYVEKGTQAHWPPPGALAGWAERHNIPEFLAMRAIAREGTEKQPFLQPAFDFHASGVESMLQDTAAQIEGRWNQRG